MRSINVKPRKRKKPKYKSLRLTKRIKPPALKKLPSSFQAIKSSFVVIKKNKKIFLGMIAIYFLLNILFVKGLASSVDVPGLKHQLTSSNITGFSLNATLVGVVAGTSGSSASEVGNLYQSILVIVSILAFIWLFRHASEAKKTKQKLLARQPYYEGMTPLIPFLLVLCVVGLQLIPMLAGVSLFSVVQQNGLAATGLEVFVWALLAILLTLLTFYMISSSLFALIIVTLPDTKPIAALRSARKVVEFRRLALMRKLFILALLVGLVYLALLMLIIIVLPVIAEWFAVLLAAFILPLGIGSIYKLYRELL